MMLASVRLLRVNTDRVLSEMKAHPIEKCQCLLVPASLEQAFSSPSTSTQGGGEDGKPPLSSEETNPVLCFFSVVSGVLEQHRCCCGRTEDGCGPMEGRVGRVLRAAGYPQSTKWLVGTFWLPQPHVEKGQEE